VAVTINKKALSERDICFKYLTPAILQAGWDLHLQMREEYPLSPSRILVRGKLVSRGAAKRADYALFHKPGLPIAVVEAKDNNLGDGTQQALNYAEMLDVPFAFSSNGDGFLFHDMTGAGPAEQTLALDEFPSPAELWERFRAWKGWPPEIVLYMRSTSPSFGSSGPSMARSPRTIGSHSLGGITVGAVATAVRKPTQKSRFGPPGPSSRSSTVRHSASDRGRERSFWPGTAGR